jgi:MSHA pilin protein MshD
MSGDEEMMTSRTNARGATLVELIAAIVIIGVGLSGVLVVFIRNTVASADPMIAHQAIAVAEAHLEEALAKNFTTGPGNTRPTFDDVRDYHNLTNNGCVTTNAACPTLGSCVCNQNGDPIAGLAGYTVQMSAELSDLHNIMVASVGAIRVQVTVTPPSGGNVIISGYRTDY